MKIQHALRAFTAKDRKGIKLAAENFPETAYYDVDELLTQMGIGEAMVTVLDEKGIPTPLVHTLLRAPQSRMDILSDAEVHGIVTNSKLAVKYNSKVDRESAYEMLNDKLAEAEEAAQQAEMKHREEETRMREAESQRKAEERAQRSGGKSTFERIATSSAANTVVREVTRGILGVLGLGGRSRSSSSRKRSKPTWW
jgi:predicted flap endonuclease-1-like 5' DNA nuclease